MSFAERIESNLTKALQPTRLDVHDDSEMHRGHSGYREGGETHFRVLVVSARFQGMSRVARQRLVYDTLSAELSERVHALQLTCRTPEEDAKLAS
jgi:BolA protein